MKTKLIPIKAAKDIAEKYDATIVCIVTWDGKTGVQHVVTYGKSLQECGWAADLGNKIKEKILKWPKDLCNAMPKRLEEGKMKKGGVNREYQIKQRPPDPPRSGSSISSNIPYKCSGYCNTMITSGIFCPICLQDYKEDPDSMK